MKKLVYLFYVVLLSGARLMAQGDTGALRGTVKDASGTAVPFASVALFKESKLITGAVADIDGKYNIAAIPVGEYTLRVSSVGYAEKTVTGVVIRSNQVDSVDIVLAQGQDLAYIQIRSHNVLPDHTVQSTVWSAKDIKRLPARDVSGTPGLTGGANTRDRGVTIRGSRGDATIYSDGTKTRGRRPGANTNEFRDFGDNDFLSTLLEPLSTFSVDVDKASYTLVRKLIQDGTVPVAGAVRTEELINYFDYNYPGPVDEHPFHIITELTDCPWNAESKILKIALQGKRISPESLPPSVFTFLVDVSGSMDSPHKLPLVQASLLKLLESLRPEDKVGIVVYAGAAGVVLEPRFVKKKNEIVMKIMEMKAGGSTAGGRGIQLAYSLAEEHFIRDGNNRIILCTDGDFNVGISSESELADLIERERQKGIYLTVLGFGMGNYKDSKLEILADKGNGNYAYIDDYAEAEKFLGKEFAGSMYTIAKDVKIQVEFNPALVKSYRLIGYENRILAAQDFNDDKKDAGEIGAGRTVTALYEIRADEKFCKKVDALKYKKAAQQSEPVSLSEIGTVKFRYKKPSGTESILITRTVPDQSTPLREADENTRFAIAVAQFGMLLRKSEYLNDVSLEDIIRLASDAETHDTESRQEFIALMKAYKKIGGIAKQ